VAGHYLDLDARIWFFTDYYSISPGMISQIPGKGAKYMIAFSDSDGTPLVGETNYHLKLPENIPAANFWSVTLYEAENASGLANGRPFPSLGSRHKPVQNTDGSTIFISDRKRQTEKKATGWRPYRVKAISRSCASTARPNRQSTRVGNRATLKKCSDWYPRFGTGQMEDQVTVTRREIVAASGALLAAVANTKITYAQQVSAPAYSIKPGPRRKTHQRGP
jgi:hypothetical protein